MAITAKRWVYPKEEADKIMIEVFCELLRISPLVARVLINRGMTDTGDAKKFIEKSVSSLYSPYLLTDMDKAVKRIEEAIEKGEKITVYGDYDVDGITSTAMTVSYLRKRGADAGAYIPDRQNEGYGVNRGAVEKIIAGGTKLIITVDTGITAGEEVKYAKEHGIDVIVTDHHECKESLPEAVAVINPKRADSDYPFKDLAGVGVAFKLICALAGSTEAMLDTYSDIVALGTIADVVNLVDENRVICGIGLDKLKKNPNMGLMEVIKTIGSASKWNNSAVVSYSIAPRINAAGRMSSAMTAVRLLLTEDRDEAYEMAMELDAENKERQVFESVIFAEAEEMLKAGHYENKKVLILAKRGWHHGIIGVVASRICDKYQKSCILISVEDEWCKASGRSMNGINLFEALSKCADILENFGGHAYAAGFSIKEEFIEKLDERLNDYAEKVLPKIVSRDLHIDAEVEIEDIGLAAVKETEVLGPYGAGNKTPIFAVKEVIILGIRTLSEGKHCRILAQKGKRTIEVIAFGQGKLAEEYMRGDMVDIAGELNVNIYNGQARVQLILSDIRLSGSDIPQRSDFAAAYKYLRGIGGRVETEIMRLTRAVGAFAGRTMTKAKVENIILVFADLGILEYSVNGDRIKASLMPAEPGTKVNISASEVYKAICEN